MQVIQEKIDKELFIDLVLNLQDLENISSGEMLNTELHSSKQSIFLGIRKFIPGEEDAISKRKIQKSHQKQH
jgi:hypothetical protein